MLHRKQRAYSGTDSQDSFIFVSDSFLSTKVPADFNTASCRL